MQMLGTAWNPDNRIISIGFEKLEQTVIVPVAIAQKEITAV